MCRSLLQREQQIGAFVISNIVGQFVDHKALCVISCELLPWVSQVDEQSIHIHVNVEFAVTVTCDAPVNVGPPGGWRCKRSCTVKIHILSCLVG